MNTIFEPTNLIELSKLLRDQNVPETKWGLYYERFLERKARKLGVPLTGSFELTPFCNLACKMCYVSLVPSQYSPDKLLPVKTWESIMFQAYEAGMRNASLTGGECLTYPGFTELYMFLYNLGIHPGVLTNGGLVDDEILNLFVKYPPRMVQVTLYGSSDEAYERVTGYRVFHKVYHNLEMMHFAEIPVKIAITPNEFMKDDVTALLETAQGLGIPFNINANLIPPRKNTGRAVHDISVDEYVDIFKKQSEMHHGVLDPVDPVEIPDENHNAVYKEGLLCGAGRSAFGVKYNGELCPCLSLDELSVDVLSHGFSVAWQEVNRLANEHPLPAECGGCVFYGRCLPCVAMHKNAPVPGHCDPRICERTKKLMAAGFIPLPDTEGKKHE